MESILKFLKKSPLLATIIYISLTALVVAALAMWFLSIWTHHGEEAEVPAVRGMSFAQAGQELSHKGFTYEIIDSVYDFNSRPGTVVEQSPRPGASVKPGRLVYLTVVAFTPKLVSVPNFYNVSLRQGKSMFESLGVRNLNIVRVPSEYRDLVLAAKFNGVPLRPGARIPVTATITLEVGAGAEIEEPGDSIDTDADDSLTINID